MEGRGRRRGIAIGRRQRATQLDVLRAVAEALPDLQRPARIPRRPRDASIAETVRWEVMTRDGFSRPGMIGGSFQALADRPEISTAAGATAKGVPVTLKLVSHSGQRVANFALATPRIAFAAATEALVR